MAITRLDTSDLDRLSELQPPNWRDIRPSFEKYLASPHCHPFKFSTGKTIIGVGASILFGNTGWMAHIIVRKRDRRKGVGSALVSHLVSALRQRKCQTISLVASEEGRHLYQRHGFENQMTYVVFARGAVARNCDLPNHVRQARPMDLGAMRSLDQETSGENRSRLFPDLLCDTWLFENADGIVGFFAPYIGEGVVLARTTDAGLALLEVKKRYGSLGALPIVNDEGRQWYEENGYVRLRVAHRMHLGPSFSWRPEQIFARVGGHVG